MKAYVKLMLFWSVATPVIITSFAFVIAFIIFYPCDAKEYIGMLAGSIIFIIYLYAIELRRITKLVEYQK